MIREKCSEQLNQVIDALNQQGATVYFVGGCVRDDLMNQPCHDFDMEIFGIEEETLVAILKQYGCRKEGSNIVIDCTPKNIHMNLSYLIQAISFMLNMKIFYV